MPLHKNQKYLICKGKAIAGYYAVAYFTRDKPVKADEKFSYSWKGANWPKINDKE